MADDLRDDEDYEWAKDMGEAGKQFREAFDVFGATRDSMFHEDWEPKAKVFEKTWKEYFYGDHQQDLSGGFATRFLTYRFRLFINPSDRAFVQRQALAQFMMAYHALGYRRVERLVLEGEIFYVLQEPYRFRPNVEAVKAPEIEEEA